MRILTISAHPDDEVLGCGGTIAALSGKCEAFTLIVTEGCSAQFAEVDTAEMIERKKAAAAQANRILGVKDVLFGDFRDMSLENTPQTALNDFIRRIICDIRPDVLFTHSFSDLNSDHRQIFRSVAVAARPCGFSPRKILLYETPSSTEWLSYDPRQSFVPNVFVDISETLEKKIEAFMCYETEIRDYPHPRSAEGLNAYAAFRGLAAGLEKAEAFTLYRCIGLPL